MTDPILRKKLRGRKVDASLHWSSWLDTHKQAFMYKAKRPGDPFIAPGYKHRSMARIRSDHKSSRRMQDMLEEIQLRNIRHTPRGKRRDYLIKELYHWRQQGRPTQQDQNLDRRFGHREKRELIRTNQKGRPEFTDYVEDNEKKALNRSLERM